MSIESFGLPPAPDTSDLDVALSNIKPITLTATATSSTPGIPSDIRLDSESQEVTPEDLDTTEEVAEDTDTSTEDEATEEPSSEFVQQFKDTFGIEPSEAIEVLNGLKAFQEEVTLMRQWGVTPGEYDARINQVKEFYASLPEDGRQQFNSVEGALAIWEHLQKQNTTSKSTKVKPGGSSKKTPAKAAEVIKKSDVLRMDDATFRANAHRINQAVLEGRFLEDV